LLRLTEGRADLVQEPCAVGAKVAGLGTKEYKLMLDSKEGKYRTCILAKNHLSIFLLRNYSDGAVAPKGFYRPNWPLKRKTPQIRWLEDWQRNDLFDFILNSNLFVCNRGNVPTFTIKTCQTIIELTLVSDSLVSAVKNWAVSDEHSFSNRRFIETILSLDSPLSASFANPRWADWHRIKEVLTNILPMEPSKAPQTHRRWTEQ